MKSNSDWIDKLLCAALVASLVIGIIASFYR